MAQLCGPRRCRAILALLASLLLSGAEVADGDRSIYGEGLTGVGEEWMAEAGGGARGGRSGGEVGLGPGIAGEEIGGDLGMDGACRAGSWP